MPIELIDDRPLPVSSVFKRLRDDFIGLDADKWTYSGAGWAFTAGAVLTQDALANTNSWLLSKQAFTLPLKVGVCFSLSQRIANQTFYIELVSVNSATGLPDDKHKVGWLINGTTATQARYYSAFNGAQLDSAAVTVNSTASLAILEIEAAHDETNFRSVTVESTAAKPQGYRRNRKLPDPTALYKLRIRAVNGASAPASATTLTVDYVFIEDYNDSIVEFLNKGSSLAADSVPVLCVNTANVSITTTSSGGYTSKNKLISAASTNATSVKTSAANVGKITADNLSASTRYLKLYDKASAPTVGTDTPFHTFVLPASSQRTLDFPAGLRLSTGFAFAITAALADTDTTAVAAGDVVINYEYV